MSQRNLPVTPAHDLSNEDILERLRNKRAY